MLFESQSSDRVPEPGNTSTSKKRVTEEQVALFTTARLMEKDKNWHLTDKSSYSWS